MVKKPATATKSPAKKPAARTIKAKAAALVAKVKAPAPVVTLKHIAAEIAEAHELPKPTPRPCSPTPLIGSLGTS